MILQLKISDLSAARHWLRTDELFSSDSNVKEALTAEGQREIDGTMSALVPCLPNSALVVEGYFDARFGERAVPPSKAAGLCGGGYLEKRFSLQPNMVAVMPMSDSPPPGVGKSVFDGVSLVLTRQ